MMSEAPRTTRTTEPVEDSIRKVSHIWRPEGGTLLNMAEVEPREMQWLWHPYLPMGSASMLFGPGGLGKSHIACDIAARVSSGRPLPGQNFEVKPRKVLLMTAEDDPEAVLQPRLLKAGAALANISVPTLPFVLDLNGLKSMQHHMHNASATVVFIDPVVSYMGGKIDMNKMNEVRTLTGALHTMAQKTGTAIIIVHHSRKGAAGEDYEKAAGSADFNNAVRSVLFVSRDDGGQCLLKHVKSNYSALGGAIPYTIDLHQDIVEWGDVINTIPYRGTGRKRALAQHWIQEFLATGPQPAKIIEEAAKEAGFNFGTLNRAKNGVAESYLVREDGVNVWWWRLL